MTTPIVSRRGFLMRAAMTATALPIALGFISTADAAGLTKLPLDNAQAKALAYVEDAVTSKHPSFKTGSSCSNCQFFTAATGACALFSGFSVSPKGWCSAWSKRPA